MVQRIAVIDPVSRQKTQIEQMLEKSGYEPVDLGLTSDALSRQLSMALHFDLLENLGDCHLIIMERHFPAMDAVEIIRMLKENKYTVQIPVMILTEDVRYESVLECINAGAADYLVKPVDQGTLARRVALLLGRNGGYGDRQGVEGVFWNFQDFLTRELKRSERSDLPLSVIQARIATPDEVQRDASSAELRKAPDEEVDARLTLLDSVISGARVKLRDTDTVLRYGPQEFIAVLPMTPRAGADIVEERLLEVFDKELSAEDRMEFRQLQIYTGIATFPEEASSRLDLLEKAEKALLASPGSRGETQLSSGGSSEQVFWKTLYCPVCRQKFLMEKVRDRAFKIKDSDSDFRQIYEKGSPLLYSIPVCPGCFYSAFYPDFERVSEAEAVKLKRARLSRGRLASRVNYRNKRSLESAIISFHLAAECYHLRRTPPSTFARLYHRAAWLLRDAGKQEEEKKMLAMALDYYEKALSRENLRGRKLSDPEIAYLVGDLSIRLNQYRKAIEYFSMLVKSPHKDRRSKLVHLAAERLKETQKILQRQGQKASPEVSKSE
jgi:hypothetical protein